MSLKQKAGIKFDFCPTSLLIPTFFNQLQCIDWAMRIICDCESSGNLNIAEPRKINSEQKVISFLTLHLPN